jgi:hypothetical protein
MLIDTSVQKNHQGRNLIKNPENTYPSLLINISLSPVDSKLKPINRLLTPKKKPVLSMPEIGLDFTFNTPSVQNSIRFDNLDDLSEISRYDQNTNWEHSKSFEGNFLETQENYE